MGSQILCHLHSDSCEVVQLTDHGCLALRGTGKLSAQQHNLVSQPGYDFGVYMQLLELLHQVLTRRRRFLSFVTLHQTQMMSV